MTIRDHMTRANIRSNRELSSLTGIPHSTLDKIVKDPTQAKGYQLRNIADVCGISYAELGELVMEGGQG